MIRYKLGKKLFPNIYEVLDYPDVIAKKYKSSKDRRQEEKRLSLIKSVQNVPRIIHSTQCTIYMNKIQGEDLHDIMYKKNIVPENEVKLITYNLLRIVKEIHQFGIIHGDIKPENIMYNESSQEITLIDFETKRHTNEYRSPESFLNKQKTVYEDIWCIGSTIYTLLMGHNPYNNRKHLFSGLSHHSMANKGLSDDSIDFVEKLLSFEPEQRPSIECCLKHRWFVSYKDNTIDNIIT